MRQSITYRVQRIQPCAGSRLSLSVSVVRVDVDVDDDNGGGGGASFAHSFTTLDAARKHARDAFYCALLALHTQNRRVVLRGLEVGSWWCCVFVVLYVCGCFLLFCWVLWWWWWCCCACPLPHCTHGALYGHSLIGCTRPREREICASVAYMLKCMCGVYVATIVLDSGRAFEVVDVLCFTPRAKRFARTLFMQIQCCVQLFNAGGDLWCIIFFFLWGGWGCFLFVRWVTIVRLRRAMSMLPFRACVYAYV